jgi:hypothetical protein
MIEHRARASQECLVRRPTVDPNAQLTKTALPTEPVSNKGAKTPALVRVALMRNVPFRATSQFVNALTATKVIPIPAVTSEMHHLLKKNASHVTHHLAARTQTAEN